MGKYFGTDGFRGEANVALNAEHAYKIGRYIGWYFGQEHKAKIVIGRDTRLSGSMLEAGISAGITASGTDTYHLHVTTTPSVAYLVKKEGFDCGVMISASHNPYYDNGIKLIGADGRKISAEIEDAIEKYIDGEIEELPLAKRENIGNRVHFTKGVDEYVEHLAKAPQCKLADIRFAIDCSNGSASDVAWKVFEKLGLKPDVIYAEPNGININDGCGSTHTEKLQEYVKANGLVCGFAYDGDADRCLAVDAEGNEVDGDQIMYVCGKYLNEQGRLKDNRVVTTIMSNLGFYKSLERDGMKYSQTDVGDKYVAEEMFANGYSLGGEQSGHIIFGDYASTGDGILTSLLVLEAMSAKGKGLKELTDECEIYPQLLKNVVVKDKKEAMNHPAVLAAIEAAKEELGEDGRVLVRASGTEPKVRVMAEAKTDEQCSKYVERIIAVIKEQKLEA